MSRQRHSILSPEYSSCFTQQESTDKIGQPWKVIIADDEKETHLVTRMVLQNYTFEGRKLELLSTYSGEETKKLVQKHPDTVIILLDVVMETDNAGLDVVKYIRDELNNQLIQIVLRTGHPGRAPENKIIAEYGINDYKSKIDFTSQKLFTTITTLLRSYCLAFSYNELNQKLKKELAKRHQAEKDLQKARDNLEQRVEERTSELGKANLRLKEEVRARTIAEEVLRKSNEMTRALLNATSDVAFLIKPDGTLLSINETAAKIFSHNLNEYSGKSLFEYFSTKTNRLIKAQIDKVIRSGIPSRLENKAKKKVFEVSMFPVFDEKNLVEKIAIYSHDITNMKQAEIRIQTLTHDLIKAQETERERIARDLHDRVAQDLSTSRIICETLFDKQTDVSDEVHKRVSMLSDMLQRTIQNIRDIAYDLRPPILDQLGLVRAVFHYCEEFSETVSIPVDFHSAGIDQLDLNLDIKINLYRLIQEAMNNIRKHAGATLVRINMVASFPNILIRITDNGKGFDIKKHKNFELNPKHMGLRSMEERVSLLKGTMDIQSKPGSGTRILIEIPFLEKKSLPG
jgi:PAS domain S-box-containing protein